MTASPPILLAITFASLFSGCGIVSPKTVTLLTNRMEFTLYSEAFNSAQESYRVELHYREKPSEVLNKDETPPDLIISEDITGKANLGRFHGLGKLLEKKNLRKDVFYPALLAMGRRDKQQILLPVSFDLPLLIYDNRIIGDENTFFSLNFKKIRDNGEKFNRDSGQKQETLGFAPRWDPGFLYLVASAFGAEFTEGSSLPLSWNEKNLKQAVDFVADWSESVNGGAEKENRYAEKYLYDPPYRQVSLGRVKYACIKASDFFLLPENRRLALDFRWISHNDKIMALESVLFAGIPLKSKTPRGGEAFLLWLLDPATQRMLLEKTDQKVGYGFGLASGFSSLKEINEREFPRYYPLLAGHIPPADMLSFPPPVPGNWEEIKNQVLLPWMLKQTGRELPGTPLESQLRAWYLKHTD